jgi:hypothetical protein
MCTTVFVINDFIIKWQILNSIAKQKPNKASSKNIKSKKTLIEMQSLINFKSMLRKTLE